MIRKRIFYLFIVVFTTLIANIKTSAQNVEQIYMKSGSVVEGYIAEQKPGKHITFQTTKATIVVKEGFKPCRDLAREIKLFAKKNTANYKTPRLIEFVDELPKTHSGKIRRVEIRNKK